MSREGISRGDIVIINFSPQAGHEQSGRRLGIVLSPEQFNQVTGFVVVCPITNQKKGYPFEVELPEKGIEIEEGREPVTGVILTDQVKSLDKKARNIRVLKKMESEDKGMVDIVEDCLAKVATYLT